MQMQDEKNFTPDFRILTPDKKVILNIYAYLYWY